MGFSSLIIKKILSPNHSGKRKYEVTRITIHHMAAAWTIEQCGQSFKNPARYASSNYGVDGKGRIAGYVDEKNRAWTSASRDNDNRAITIEVANDRTGGNWSVSDKALAATIDLCVDICKRYGKKKLIWFGDKNKTLSYKPKSDEMILTVHRWFQATSCPGPYLYTHMGYIAEEVTKRLKTSEKKYSKDLKGKTYKVTANKLNLHTRANKTSETIMQLKKGDKVELTGYHYTNWYQVKYESKKGWMSKKYLSKA